jgi:hypothetical protein
MVPTCTKRTLRFNFYFSDAGRKHVARHFDIENLAGSHFLKSTFSTPDDLLSYLNAIAPLQIIPQSSGKSAFCFRIADGRMAGTSGLAQRSHLPAHAIVREIREGYSIEIGLVSQLPLTAEFCIIAQETEEGLSIITAFPGGYARPFAQKSQPREEYELNKKFWEEHVLLKQKNTMQ